jgi:DNA repair exonuclease SbcCD nuclease subunit
VIATADFHLSENRPQCRKDNYIKSQLDKLDFICENVKSDDGIWLHAGDFFDTPKPSLFFVREIIKGLKRHGVSPYIIPGQHDLPYHSLSDINKSALGVLSAAGVIHLITSTEPIEINDGVFLYGAPFGVKTIKPLTNGLNILLIHELIIKDKPEWFGQNARTALQVLDSEPYDIIISGDNHNFFYVEHDYRLLVNLGSIMRKTIGQIDHIPRLLWTDFDSYDIINIPHEKDVFREIEIKNYRDTDYVSFVDELSNKVEFSFNFINNLKNYINVNSVDDEVQKQIWRFVDG